MGYAAVVGRISNFQAMLFAGVGVFAFEFNSQLFWRFNIEDPGFGMRAFSFGSTYGLVVSLFMSRRKFTKDHPDFSSDYYYQLFAFIGAIIAWALLPAFTWASLFH